MKVTPLTPPPQAQQQSATTTNNTDARARALNAFQTGQVSPETAAKIAEKATSANQAFAQPQQEHPVANPSKVAPEEMRAIQAPIKPIDNVTVSEDTQAPEVEAKPQVDPATEKKFAEIARQERILRARAQKQAQEIKAQQEALNKQKAELDAKAKEYEQGWIPKDRLKNDPLSALAEAQLSYEELTQRLLDQGTLDPRVEAQVKRLEAHIASLEGKIAASEKASQQAQSEQYQAALRQIEADAKALIQEDPTTYEAVAKTNSIKDVVELIERTYQQDGVILSVEQAAQEVEDYLVEEGYKTVSRIEKIKKRLAQSTAAAAEPKQVEKTQATPADTKQQSTTKTLTNSISASRKLSAKERAIARANGYTGDFE